MGGMLGACRTGAVILLAALCVTALGKAPLPVPASATVHAAVVGRADCPPTAALKRQLRGLWISTVANLDWPSRPGLPAAQQQEEYTHLLDEAQRLRMNAVFVQVRPSSDAFYPSPYEPWSAYLTGQQGLAPGYDPLAFLVAEAHRRNLEFHAWFNPYRVSTRPDLDALAPEHPARQHPDWVVGYGNQLFYDPGNPEIRGFIEDVVLDIVEHYDIDGVHLDDYFYPHVAAGDDFDDEETYQHYGAEQFADKDDWRRDNVNQLIQELSTRISGAKSWVTFGVSPFGVWRDKAVDPGGSDTTAGVHDYDDLYADVRTWIHNEWISYVAPQLYWAIGFRPAAYDVLVAWWAHEVEGTGVSLYIGQSAFKIGDGGADPAWNDPEEMPRHLALNQSYPAVSGDIYFRIHSVLANPLGFADRLAEEIYPHPALVPVRQGQQHDTPPPPPTVTSASTAEDGVELRWSGADDDAYYAIYRVDGAVDPEAVDPCAVEDPANLLGTAAAAQGTADDLDNTDRGPRQTFTDHTAVAGAAYTYLVTALDRGHNESSPSLISPG